MLARCSIWFRQKFKEDSLKNDWKLLGIFALITLPVMVLLGLQKRLRNSNGFLSDFSWFDFIIRDFVVDYPSSCYYRCSCIWGFMLIFLLPNGKEFLYGLGMDTYQINRISAWLDPFSYAKTIAYQQTQGMVSIGSGGLTGKGFNVVDLSVPVRESDMIFTVIAEDFGFIGSAVVMGLYLC